MKSWKKTTNNANLIKQGKLKMTLVFILSFGLVVLWTGSTTMLYGQGTLGETVGTMEISQQVDNGVNSSAPKGKVDTAQPVQDTNKTTEPPSRAPGNMRGRPNPPQTPLPDTQQQVEAPTVVETPAVNPAAEAPAMTEDTNVPDANDFNAFKRELDRIDMAARGEDNQWLGKQEKKAELARAMDDVAVAELRFLRKVAADANDSNTVEAIDLVLKKRMDRLNKLVTKLENEVREERRQQAPERPRRTPRTSGVQQDPAQTDRPARNSNPVRRTRDTVNQEQQ